MPAISVWSITLENAVIDHLINAVTPGPLDGAVLHLSKAATTLDKSMVPADFTEADFDGYAAIPIVWAPRTRKSEGAMSKSQLCSFVANGSLVTNMIYGWYVTDVGLTVVYMAHSYDVQIPVFQAGSSVDVVVQISEKGPGSE